MYNQNSHTHKINETRKRGRACTTREIMTKTRNGVGGPMRWHLSPVLIQQHSFLCSSPHLHDLCVSVCGSEIYKQNLTVSGQSHGLVSRWMLPAASLSSSPRIYTVEGGNHFCRLTSDLDVCAVVWACVCRCVDAHTYTQDVIKNI